MQVSVPPSLGYKIVFLGACTFALTYAWDHLLRLAFPAPKPPQKGYLAFKKELKAIQRKHPDSRNGTTARPHEE